jgi:glycosyltransferase involved in cell wall biosynthesis
MKDIYVIIPIYNPIEEITTKFISELEKEFKNIIIINDGCDPKHENFFKKFNKHIVLTHHVNQGKGRAMKTAFNYLLEEIKDFKGAVVADCDAQHAIEDIKNVSNETLKYQNSLILGSRDFDKEGIPLKSRLGNKITKSVFQLFIGLSLKDTQTGLRGYSKKLMPTFLKTSGERYEFETNMLILCKELEIPIKEVDIKTIYIDGNVSSHFNPVKDSIIIYKLFFKYIIASVSSFLVDILLFATLMLFNISIMSATVIARIFSSFYNFKINQKLIFKKSNKTSLIKYFVLAAGIMLTSGASVTLVHNLLSSSPTLTKIIVDSLLFIASFILQREWVFKK